MVIISKNSHPSKYYIHSAQFRYAVIYVVITFAALLFLNIYCSKISQEVFYNNKKTSMIEKCRLAASAVGDLEALNVNTAAEAIAGFEDLSVSRLLITDETGMAIYDSARTTTELGQYALFPEIVNALRRNDVFYWYFSDGIMRSTAATPVYSYGTLIGCVYMMEFDETQGTLFAALQNNILFITLLLEIVVILYSFVFATLYTRRLRQIMRSIRTVREGDYSHTLTMSGRDELKDLSDEFNGLIARLQVSEMKRSRFVSDASHELKTPLASIKLLTDSILQNEMDAETVREFVSDIGAEADRLNRLSQKLLTLSRTDAQVNTDYEITYITPTIDRVTRMLQNNADHSHVQIQKEYACDPTIMILEDDLYQIIFNLIENGIKYNVAGGLLRIKLFEQDDDVIIQFSDTGVGIPQDSVEHIFERFYRVDKARSRSTGGSGLGLSIVKTLVERNNGTIHVESQLHEGTTFTLRFPIFDAKEDTV